MDELIPVPSFDAEERDWEATHARLIATLGAMGALLGDDPALIRAKADCAYQLIRRIIEEVPNFEVTSLLPAELSPEQMRLVQGSLRSATFKGMEIALKHATLELTGCITELCTSKLADPKRRDT